MAIQGRTATFIVFDELKNIPEMNKVSYDAAICKVRSQIERARQKGHRHVRIHRRDAAALNPKWHGTKGLGRVKILVDTVERWVVGLVTSRLVGEIE